MMSAVGAQDGARYRGGVCLGSRVGRQAPLVRLEYGSPVCGGSFAALRMVKLALSCPGRVGQARPLLAHLYGPAVRCRSDMTAWRIVGLAHLYSAL